MAAKLVPGNFEAGAAGARLFGIQAGQRRPLPCIIGPLWYNQAGQRVGEGDLSSADIDSIQSNIEPNEMFFLVDPDKVSEAEAGGDLTLQQVVDRAWVAVNRAGSMRICGTGPEVLAFFQRMLTYGNLSAKLKQTAKSLAN